MSDSNDTIIEERGITSVNGASQKQSKAKKGVILGVAAVLVTLMIWLTLDAENDDDTATDAGRPGSIRIAQPFTPAPDPVVIKPANIKPAIQRVPVPVAQEKNVNEKLLEAARRAPVLAFTGKIRPLANGANNQRVAPGAVFAENLSGGAAAVDPDALEERLNAIPLAGAKARQIANLHMSVPKGTHIPCTLETAMSSDQPGLVSCIVARDVLGGSGQVVLMEKGSKAFGQYQGGIKRGQKRLFVLWTQIRTPSGVVVTLDSPATDAIGRAGLTGRIDAKFGERFGAALLLSVVSDASAFLFERAGEELAIDFQSTSQAPDDAVAIAIEESINIAPTLYKNQGEAVNIFVARDLDFSDVYRLRRTQSVNQILDHMIDTDIYQLPMVLK